MSWSVLPRKRKSIEARPAIDSEIHHDSKVSLFCEVSRLLSLWRDDPERLAVMMGVWTLMGCSAHNAAYDVGTSGAYGDGHEGTPPLTDDQARALIERALHRRNARVLRNRAEGALMVLEELAQIAEAYRKHQLQVGIGVRTCRLYEPGERLAEVFKDRS